MPTPPAIVDDGNLSIAQQDGAPEYSFPFAYRGDNKTFVAKVTFRVDVDSFVPPIAMSQRMFPNLGRGYMLDFDQPQMVGQQLLSYGVYYGNVPQTGIEYESVTYTIQKPTINDYGTDSTINGYSDIFDGYTLYEYSLFRPLPQLFYAHFLLAPFGPPPDNFQAVYIAGNTAYSGSNPDGTYNALAENTTSKIYRGRIFVRMSKYARIDFAQAYPRIAAIPPTPP